MIEKKVKPVCSECGSDELSIDGPIEWCVETQQFIAANISDSTFFCNADCCQSETDGIWQPID